MIRLRQSRSRSTSLPLVDRPGGVEGEGHLFLAQDAAGEGRREAAAGLDELGRVDACLALEHGGEQLALRLRHHERAHEDLARRHALSEQPGAETLGGPRRCDERDLAAVQVERARHIPGGEKQPPGRVGEVEPLEQVTEVQAAQRSRERQHRIQYARKSLHLLAILGRSRLRRACNGLEGVPSVEGDRLSPGSATGAGRVRHLVGVSRSSRSTGRGTPRPARRAPRHAGRVPVHSRDSPVDVPLAPVDDAAVRGILDRRGVQSRGTATCSNRDRPDCRWRSTSRRRSATTPTTGWRRARSAGSGSRSTPWRTWRRFWRAFRSTRSRCP